ncbi:MAG: L-lactate permease [Phycisphaerales bacterium]|nr:L-lactate permease [Planctomycetota bacterium]MCH8509644.1 L-lactate permease [Phycisphaerales bacterium]
MSLTLAILPLALLVLLMTATRPRRWLPLPAHIALPAMAALAYALQLLWFRAGSTPEASAIGGVAPGRWIHAAVIDGVLSALTPIGIVFGAVLFFKTMEASGAMRVLTERLRGLSPHPVAQLMLVGWSFSFLIEGLCGFGAPAALAAPILVGLGFPPVRVAAMCLIMNSVPVSFGAVGTPIWFGLGELGLSPDELLTVGTKAALINAVAALVIPVLALRVLLPWRTIRASIVFVMLVVLASVLPYAFAATLSSEFPSIIGGLSGTIFGALLAHRRVSLSSAASPAHAQPRQPEGTDQRFGLFRAASPLLAVILLLAVTRIDQFGLRTVLTSDSPAAALDLGLIGGVWVTPGLVVGFREILGTGASWSMPLLFVPFLVPFVLVCLVSVPLLRIRREAAVSAWADTLRRLYRPAVALVGALVLVKLMMLGGEQAPVMLIGRAMADAAGQSWIHLAPLLGALGSFFSGSNTVSNLTFAPVQAAIAGSLGLDITSVLALQTVGGSLGNMVCIHNIVAVAAVIGLRDRPAAGEEHLRGGVASILRLTIVPMLIYAAIAAAGAALL